MHSIDVGSK